MATGERQDFAPYPLSYFEKMWDIFEPHGYLQLFFTSFGDTVLYKKGAWAGQHGDMRPNEVMHWEVIEWAKAHGFCFYDFEGIEPEAAHCALAGQPLPESMHRSTSRFKLGFSNQALVLPPAQIYARSSLLRWGYRTVWPWLDARFPRQKLLMRLRVA
jgi:lipid II:glycine glycyltransferase (peptidoglycan interpeptide bridge formation enzyme)